MAENDDEYNQFPQRSGQPEKGRKGTSRDSYIEEYRLIPVEEAEYLDEDEKIIDFVGLARDLWDHRMIVIKVFSIFVILGVLLYLFGERTYYSETSLMPEARSGSQVGQLLQQYQGLLGMQLPTGSAEGEELSVTLYPKIVESLPFQIELLQHEVYFDRYGRSMSLYEYLSDVRELTLFQKTGQFLWGITFGLPGTIMNFFSSPDTDEMEAGIDFSQYSDFEIPRVIDPGIRSAIRELENWITVRIEPQDEFITIGASLPDAQASAETVNAVKELLTRYVTEHRVVKATQDRDFIESQYEQARVRFQQAQDSLATFQDQNVRLSTARSLVVEQRLQSEYTLTYDVYHSLATRLEEANIKIQEETPVFRVHEPVTISTSPATPNLKRILAGVIFLGLFFGIGLIYVRRGLWRFYTDFKNRSPAQNSFSMSKD